MGRWSVGVLMSGVLVLGITASGLAIRGAFDATAEQDARQADLVAAALGGNLQQAIGSLRGIDALAADGAVSADEFALFAADVLPGSLFSALAYSEIVAAADRAGWEQRNGRPVQDLAPSGTLVPAERRDVHDVVTWVHPANPATTQVIGFDVFSEPIRRSGVEAALGSGEPVAVGPIEVAPSSRRGLFMTNVVQDADGRPIGFVSSGIAIDDVLARLPSRIDPASVTIRIGDEVLAGGGDGEGAVRSFSAGNRFTVTVASQDGPPLRLPAVVVLSTVLLAVAALRARTADTRHRKRRAMLLARQASLAELGRRLAATSSFDGVVAAALGHSAAVLGADRVELGHLDGLDRQKLLVHRTDDLAAGRPSVRVCDLCERIPLADAVRTGTTLALDDRNELTARYPQTEDGATAGDERRDGRQVATPAGHGRAMWCVPISTSDGTVWAAINFIWTDAGPMDTVEERAAAAAAAATVIGGALERAHSAEALADRASQLSQLAQAVAVAHEVTALTIAIERWLPPLVAAARATLAPAAASAGATDTVIALDADGDAPAEWSLVVTWPPDAPASVSDRMLLGTVVELVASAIGRIQRSHHEHQLIEQLQHALLAEAPQRGGLEVAVRYEPAVSAVGIGGDWYDVIELSATETGVVIGDVTGHGTTAVAMMAELQALTRHLLVAGTALPEICSQLDRSLQRHGTFATAVIGRIDVAAATCTYVNAGHPPPLLRRGRTVTELDAGRRPLLGVGPPHDEVSPITIALRPEDLVVFYTDGLVERRDEPMQRSVAALAARVADAEHRPADVLAAGFSVRQHTRADAGDDDAAALAILIRPDHVPDDT